MDLGKEIRIIQVDEESDREEHKPYQPLVEFAKLIGEKTDEGFGLETVQPSSAD